MEPFRSVLFCVGGVLLGLAADRALNMLWIDRPMESFFVRAWIYQLSLAGGIAAIALALIIGRGSR
jgi:hypothetical protein